MKCMYYLAPSLVSTHQISDDLKEVGISNWNVHVISRDPAGLKKERLHSANWLETHDLLRDGFIGANFGFIFGVLAAGALMLFKPFGPDVPGVAYVFLVDKIFPASTDLSGFDTVVYQNFEENEYV